MKHFNVKCYTEMNFLLIDLFLRQQGSDISVTIHNFFNFIINVSGDVIKNEHLIKCVKRLKVCPVIHVFVGKYCYINIKYKHTNKINTSEKC